MVQTDFGEIFTPRYAQEAQEVPSPYWNSTGVNIAPMCVFTTRSKMAHWSEHLSVVIVSDDGSHTKTQLFAFMKALMSVVKDLRYQPLDYIRLMPSPRAPQYAMSFLLD